jgi:excisionase family DNA binding protein
MLLASGDLTPTMEEGITKNTNFTAPEPVTAGQPNRMAFSIAEAAQQANLGRDHLYAAIRAGDLLARKAGRKPLVLRSEHEAYLANLPRLELGPST